MDNYSVGTEDGKPVFYARGCLYTIESIAKDLENISGKNIREKLTEWLRSMKMSLGFQQGEYNPHFKKTKFAIRNTPWRNDLTKAIQKIKIKNKTSKNFDERYFEESGDFENLKNELNRGVDPESLEDIGHSPESVKQAQMASRNF